MTSKDEKQERWFVFQQNNLLLTFDNSVLNQHAIEGIRSEIIRIFKITELNGETVFCAECRAGLCLDQLMKSVPLKQALSLIDGCWYSSVARAFAILNWDRLHQYCGQCGGKTVQIEGQFERICQPCRQAFYPRISPSIIVLVQRDDKILMARSPHFPAGVYGLIAGFVEAGESLEEAVHREVMEEVGIKIKNLRYFGSQAWPFPDSLMVGFYADYESGEIVPDLNEIEVAGWYELNNLPGRPSTSLSIASQLIDSLHVS